MRLFGGRRLKRGEREGYPNEGEQASAPVERDTGQRQRQLRPRGSQSRRQIAAREDLDGRSEWRLQHQRMRRPRWVAPAPAASVGGSLFERLQHFGRLQHRWRRAPAGMGRMGWASSSAPLSSRRSSPCRGGGAPAASRLGEELRQRRIPALIYFFNKKSIILISHTRTYGS